MILILFHVFLLIEQVTWWASMARQSIEGVIVARSIVTLLFAIEEPRVADHGKDPALGHLR